MYLLSASPTSDRSWTGFQLAPTCCISGVFGLTTNRSTFLYLVPLDSSSFPSIHMFIPFSFHTLFFFLSRSMFNLDTGRGGFRRFLNLQGAGLGPALLWDGLALYYYGRVGRRRFACVYPLFCTGPGLLRI